MFKGAVMEPTEQNTAEIVNDTDGGAQTTNVTVNIIIPMFCWFNPFLMPFVLPMKQ